MLVSGRTGRAGAVGRSTALVTRECTITTQLRDLLLASGADVPPELDALCAPGVKRPRV